MGRTDAVDSIVDELFDRPADQGISLALVAVRRGDVIVERYGTQPANEFQPAQAISADSNLLSWSVAKSITHAAVGVLVADGSIDVDAPAPIREWQGTDKAPITVLELLEMRSGLAFVEDYEDVSTSNCIEMLFSGNHVSFGAYAASLPLEHHPGSVFNYSSGTSNILARVIGDVVCGGPGVEPATRRVAVESFLRTRLFEPAGMSSAALEFDDAGDFVGSSYVYATARDFARFGELYLRDGVGDGGARVLPVGWADHARRWSAHDGDSGFGYGRHWWLWPAFPGSFAGHGYEGQYVLCVPDRDLVLVHLGKTPTDHHRGLTMRLARLVQSL